MVEAISVDVVFVADVLANVDMLLSADELLILAQPPGHFVVVTVRVYRVDVSVR